jgi:hypothetical protein
MPTEADAIEHYDGVERILEKHFAGPERYPIELMAFQFMTVLASSFPNVWSPKQTMDQLVKMKSHFAEIERIYNKLPFMMMDLFDGEAIRLVGVAKENQLSMSIALEEGGTAANSFPSFEEALENGFGVSEFLEVQKSFGKPLAKAIELAPRGITHGNKGLTSWEVVHACVVVCKEFPDKVNVPEAVNEAGPFYRLLVDMLDHHGENVDPVAAFKGWKKHMVSLDQN